MKCETLHEMCRGTLEKLTMSIFASTLTISQRADFHIGLKDLMEIVGVGEAGFVGYLIDGSIGHGKQAECVVYPDAIDVVNGRCTDRILKHLGKVVGRNADHIGKGLDIDLLTVVLCYVLHDRTKTDNVVVDHAVKLVSLACIVAENGCREEIEICSDGQAEANVL